MKKLIVLIIFAVSASAAYAQSCTKPCPPTCTEPCSKTCDKKSCTPEVAAITMLRSDLQTVIKKASESSLAFDYQLKEMTIEKGTTDEESLLFISQVAASVRKEFLNKVASEKLVASLKEYNTSPSSSKQQTVANLEKEIRLLATQVEKL